MSNQERGDAERVIGAALSVPISMINALIDLLILKGVISHDEVTHIFRGLLASKLQHLITHATEPLPLSDGGQQGMSV